LIDGNRGDRTVRAQPKEISSAPTMQIRRPGIRSMIIAPGSVLALAQAASEQVAVAGLFDAGAECLTSP
jgi:hypothetical protein